MSDLGTAVATPPPPPTTEPDVGRRVSRRGGLPGGRAVVGAFLVAAAAVGVFAAYLNATAAPSTSYLVADVDIPIGGRVTPDMFRAVALDLPPALAETAVPAGAVDQLTGRQVLGPVSRDDLVPRTIFQSPSSPEGTGSFSFSIATSRALGGNVNGGDRVDLVATYGSGAAGDFTGYIARQVPILDAVAGDAGMVITIAVEDPALVLRIINALEGAEVYVVRSDPDPGDTPADFTAPGPRTEPTEAVPAVAPDADEPADAPGGGAATPAATTPAEDEAPSPAETAAP